MDYIPDDQWRVRDSDQGTLSVQTPCRGSRRGNYNLALLQKSINLYSEDSEEIKYDYVHIPETLPT